MADFSQDKKYNYNWQSSKFKNLALSGSYISQFINDAGYVTSSVAISASYALTASYLTGTITSASNAISASYALTASYVRNAVSASYATQALSASFASTVPASGVIGLTSTQISTGSVTASVSLTQFTVTSGSSTELIVTGTGVTFGNALTDTHRATGSLLVTGSLGVTGSASILAFTGSSATIFNVINSANTFNLLETRGDVTTIFRRSNNTENTLLIDGTNNYIDLFRPDGTAHRGIRLFKSSSNLNSLEYYTQNSSVNGHFLFKSQPANVSGYGTSAPAFVFDVGTTGVTFTAGAGRIHLGNDTPTTLQTAGLGGYTFLIKNGTAPTTSSADNFILYSADRGGIAGRASAYFRSEDGTINVLGDLSGIGTATPGARLDVRAQGALSTDIALRVRNSADNNNIFTVSGNNTIKFLSQTSSFDGIVMSQGAFSAPIMTFTDQFSEAIRISTVTNVIKAGNFRMGAETGDGFGGLISTSTSPAQGRFFRIIDNFGTQWLNIGGSSYDGTDMGLTMRASTNTNTNYIRFRGFGNANEVAISDQANVGIGGTSYGTSSKYVIAQYTGTAPTTSPADAFQQYSADRNGAAGKASPHFRTEDGTVVWLGDESRLFNITASSIISNGSITVGNITSTPSTENTLNVYPPLVGGTGEGGQILLAASGGLYTSASMLDTWQNQFRVLKGTNTGGSTAGLLYMNLDNGNTQFVGAVTASAYSGLPNDYLYATRSGSAQTVGSNWVSQDVIFNNTVVSKGISYNTGTGLASLTGGKVYRVTSRLAWGAAAAYNLQFSCYTSANVQIGPTVEIIQSTNGTNNISDGTLEFIYAPGANTDIKIRTTSANTALSGETIRGDLNTQLIIQQIA